MSDCFGSSSIDLGEFGRTLRGQRAPLQGGLELTQRCNLGCVHCYCRKRPDDLAIRGKELTFAEVRRIVDEVAQEGCLYFVLTGGEPLLRRDFLDIYDYVHDRGLLIQLYTNGTLLTPRVADHLARYPPLVVEVSLYGATQATYERVTGVPGSYAKSLRGIELLANRGVRLMLKTPLMTLNIAELDLLRDYSARLGVDFYYDLSLFPRLQGMEDRLGPHRYELSSGKRLALELGNNETVKKWDAYLGKLADNPPVPSLFHCSAGLHSFFIDAYGGLMMCVIARYPSYDLRRGTFSEGWHDFLASSRAQPAIAGNPCNHCEDRYVCHQCPAWSQLEYGPSENARPVDDLCRMGHLRAAALREMGLRAFTA